MTYTCYLISRTKRGPDWTARGQRVGKTESTNVTMWMLDNCLHGLPPGNVLPEQTPVLVSVFSNHVYIRNDHTGLKGGCSQSGTMNHLSLDYVYYPLKQY